MTPSLQADEKTCPFCAETIKRAAIVCRFCHRDLVKADPATPVQARPEERQATQGSYYKDLHAEVAASRSDVPTSKANPTVGGMTALRVIGLSLLTLIAFLIGSGTNSTAAVFTVVFFVAAPCLYFLPAYEAYRREHPSMAAVVILNVFLGWTLLGWVGALAWAVSSSARSRA